MRLISLVFSLFVAANCFAADSDPAAIYLVDLERVFSESVAGKAARKTIESQVQKREGKFEVLKTELRALHADFEKQSALLSAEALAVKRQEVMKKEKELSRAMQDEREDLLEKNDVELDRVMKEVEAIIKELADEGGVRVILERDKRFVFYVKDEYDLTDQVIKELDDRKVGF